MSDVIGSMMVIHKENIPNLTKWENKIHLSAGSISIGEIGSRLGAQCSGGSANRRNRLGILAII